MALSFGCQGANTKWRENEIVNQDPTDEVDIDALVDRASWSNVQKMVALLVCLALVCDGFDNLAYGLVIPALSRQYSVLPGAFGIVLALGFVGLTLGTITAGPLGDRVGRKPVLLGCIILFALFTLATVSANSVFMLGVLRFLAGLGLGGAIPNATALIAESTGAKHRHLAVSAGAVSIIVGGILSAALASVILPHEGWRVLFYIAGGISLASAPLIYFGVPESPKFLARDVRNTAKLRGALARLRVPFPQNARITRSAGVEDSHFAFGTIFGAELLWDTLALWFAFFCAMTLGYLMASWIPTMLAGIGWDQRSSSLGLLTFNSGGLVGTGCAAALMGYFSSRILAAFAMAGVVIALSVAFAPSLAVLDPRLIFVALFALGACVIAVTSPLFAIATHIYPTRARSAGVACAVAFGRVGAIASSFIGAAVSRLDTHGVAYFYLAAALLGGSTLALLLIRQHTRPTMREFAGTPSRKLLM
jgi:AAHS family 4-hydroxybenzoate transporter-like MFS transporter